MTKIKHFLAACALVWSCSSCSKVEYTKVDKPAYLRVFNDFNTKIGVENKDEQKPFMCMLIDPTFDKDGVPTGATIKGDYLDQRDPYAPPYPSHIGSSTSKRNPEFPGKESVPAAPVVNGFDLSSWAQVPSGKHRIIFYYRPINDIPFFHLEPAFRKNVVVDTTLELGMDEIYTMHVLQTDFKTKSRGIIVRKENFHLLPLSDSMVYVNFYNYSAAGFWSADKSEKFENFEDGVMRFGIRDDVNIWMSLCKPGGWNTVPGYKFAYMGQMKRSIGNAVAPYYSFPLFADTASNRITTDVWQRFTLLVPGLDPEQIPYGDRETYVDGQYGLLAMYGNGTRQSFERGGLFLPSMIVNIHSGTYNPRSFATVNTIEVVNGTAYLTTIQRRYAKPVY